MDEVSTVAQAGYHLDIGLRHRTSKRWLLDIEFAMISAGSPFRQRTRNELKFYSITTQFARQLGSRLLIGVGPQITALSRRYGSLANDVQFYLPKVGLEVTVDYELYRRLSLRLSASHGTAGTPIIHRIFGVPGRCGNGPHYDNHGLNSLKLGISYRLNSFAG